MATPDAEPAAPPGSRPEEFRATWAQTWHTHMKPFLIANVIVAILSFMIGYMIGGYLVSVVLPVALVGAVTLLQRIASRGHGLRLSPTGVEFLRRDGVVIRMRWADIQGIVLFNQRQTGVVAPYGVGRAAASAGSAAFAEANSGAGITGLGEVLDHTQVAQQQRHGEEWVRFGDPQTVNMRLAVVDRRWIAGRVGEWFRQHRPDLLG
jgi:hypothetical protein